VLGRSLWLSTVNCADLTITLKTTVTRSNPGSSSSNGLQRYTHTAYNGSDSHPATIAALSFSLSFSFALL
jgi:hypothetical protein